MGVDLEILGGTNSGQGASREYYQRYYQEHKEKMELQRRERRVRVMKWLDDYKISSGCMRCAEEDAACLEFHHKDQNEKEFNITETVYRWSLKRVQEEVQKCEVVCANCHAILHCDEYHSHS